MQAPSVQPKFLILPCAILAALLAVGCGRERVEAPDPAGSASNPVADRARGLEPWFDDFPVDLPLAPPTGRWYGLGRRQIIETVLGNLSGGFGKDAWQIANEFFRDVDDRTGSLLAEAIDREGQNSSNADVLENILKAVDEARSTKLTEAILRALDHSDRQIRDAAMGALVSNGTPEAVRAAALRVQTLSGRGIRWFGQAALAHLDKDGAATYFSRLLAVKELGPARQLLVELLRGCDPGYALGILDPFWESGTAETRVLIAALRHVAGDDRGTSHLAAVLRGAAVQLQIQALAALKDASAEDYEPFRDDLMRLTIAATPELRAFALQTLFKLPGKQVVAALENLTQDPQPELRQAALGELVRRGETAVAEEVLREAKTATGTRFGALVDELVAAEYAPVVDLLRERFEESSGVEQREYLRRMSFSRSPHAWDSFRKVFLGEPYYFEFGDDGPVGETSVDFAAYYMGNLRGSELRNVELFDELAADDYQRRAYVLKLVANVAGGRDDDALNKRTASFLERVVCDRDEIPQVRLLALDYWKRYMGVDDILKVTRLLGDEKPAMRQAFSDFLFLYF